ncbi:DsbA family protein [Pedobacter changchengzhani]|uniref:DsbA family protein n=1 Tax=Pedobacter changchengzhani TaxID=2529274 RepID=A0A4R5MHX0_9SPHI|nr:thioredoxin domain-containing protein [Pedobacter changchengzhani]TDG34896.1 DsbA family protein [Pedobacter changchengzhani]
MSTLKPIVSKIDHIQGSDNASIEIVEYGDYECPACGDAYPILKEIEETFGHQIKFVFRNFPLQKAHQFAFEAAVCAEAAGLQNKFWEMHDALYENQYRIAEGIFEELAESIDLDLEKFKLDMDSSAVKDKIEKDFESGVRSGVNGTPSFYVNQAKFDGGVADLYQMLKESSE